MHFFNFCKNAWKAIKPLLYTTDIDLAIKKETLVYKILNSKIRVLPIISTNFRKLEKITIRWIVLSGFIRATKILNLLMLVRKFFYDLVKILGNVGENMTTPPNVDGFSPSLVSYWVLSYWWSHTKQLHKNTSECTIIQPNLLCPRALYTHKV
jgi:hypothetical protein